MSIYTDELQKFYISYFNRPADTAGLAYWEAELAAGTKTLDQVQNGFSSSAEYQAIYTGNANAVLINNLYNNLFGRNAETAGLTYWLGEMDAGRFNINTIANALAANASPADLPAILNKITAAKAFTDEVIAQGNNDYADAAAFASAGTWLNGVTDTATLTAALSTVTATVAAIAAGPVGQTFTLTTGSDISGVMTGSAGTTSVDSNDTFTATEDGAGAAGTYNTGDLINGGAGTDILNLTLTATNTGLATVVGVETINVNTSSFAAVTFDATNVSAATGTTINANNTQIGGTADFTITNLGTGATVAAGAGVTGTLNVTTTASTSQTLTLSANSATTQTVALTHSGAADVATLTAAGTVGLTATSVETLNLSGNGAAVTYTMASAMGATANNLTGSQSVTLSGNESSFDGLTINDNTTGGTTTLKITTSGDSDLSKAAVDVVNLAAVAGAHAYTLRNGQALNVTAIPTGDITLDINDQATAYTNGAVTVDLGVLFGTGAGIAVAATSATSDNISTLNLTNSTVAQTALEVLATADTDVVISGTKAVVLETASTAKSVSATGLSAALTVNYDGTTDIATVTGGSANDVFAIAAGYTTGTLAINGGTGTGDKVTLAASENLAAVTLSNVELIDLTTVATIVADFKASQLSGKSYIITGNGGDDSVEINTAASAIDTMTIDLSQLVIDSANVTSFVIDGTAKSADFGANSAITFTGSSVADTFTGDAGADTISTGAGNDIIAGGAGADNITAGEGTDTITGGAGNDIIVLTETTSAVDTLKYAEALTTDIDTVTGFKSGTDVVSYSVGAVLGNLGTAVGVDIAAPIAVGAFTAVSVVVDTTAAIADASNLIVFTSTAATTFATAIGTAVITDATTGWGNVDNATVTSVAAVWYDATNSQAVFGYVTDTAATGTALTSADTFTEVVRVGMIAADYTAANIDLSMSAF